jgi:hypothetical protein
MRFRTWLQGAGAAALVLFPFYRSMIDRPDDVRLHASSSVAIFTLPIIANLVIVTLLCAFAATWLRSTSIGTWLRLLLPGLVLSAAAEMVFVARIGWVSGQLLFIVLAGTIMLTLLLHWRWRQGEKLLFRLSGAVLIGLGFFCIFVVLRLSNLAAWRQLPNSIDESSTASSEGASRPRIVWILFDELSYQQVFGDRYPGLEMPNFDEFRKSSTLFTDTKPIADSTELAIPSILLGNVLAKVNYTKKNKLEVGTSTGLSYSFDAAQTPFAMARQYGLTTGVVGWYNPYCSLLSPYLSQCYWTDSLSVPEISARESYWQNLMHPWILYGRAFSNPTQMISRTRRTRFNQDLLRPLDIEKIQDAGNRVRAYQELMQHATGMIGPAGPDFVFFHLPLPHQAGFYDRRRQRFDASGQRSYVDNLALTDRTLAEMLDILQKSPRWKDTSVVICGDHSWRTFLWKGTKYWTPEDEAASHGEVFDSRPLLMVHLAGQTTPASVDEPFPLLRVHDILHDLVTGKQPTFSVEQSKNLGHKK